MEEKKTKQGKKHEREEKKIEKRTWVERNSIYGVPRRKVVYAHVKK